MLLPLPLICVRLNVNGMYLRKYQITLHKNPDNEDEQTKLSMRYLEEDVPILPIPNQSQPSNYRIQSCYEDRNHHELKFCLPQYEYQKMFHFIF